MKDASSHWNALSDEQKQVYNERSRQMRDTYQEYKAKYGKDEDNDDEEQLNQKSKCPPSYLSQQSCFRKVYAAALVESAPDYQFRL